MDTPFTRKRKGDEGTPFEVRNPGEKGVKKFFTPIMKRKKPDVKKRTNPECYSMPMCSVDVKLPVGLTPYKTQKLMMVRILTALRRRQHVLAESPTGSGKTMALLASTCAYLLHYNLERSESLKNCAYHTLRNESNVDSSLLVPPSIMKEEDNNKTGNLDDSNMFNPLHASMDEDFSIVGKVALATHSTPGTSKESKLWDDGVLLLSSTDSSKDSKKEACTCLPQMRIYYGTRTHKQIGQVVKEFARLPYGNKLRHTILGSREQMCINEDVRKKGDMTAACHELIKADGLGCQYKSGMRDYEKKLGMRKFVEGQDIGVWDIEDLLTALGSSTPAMCPYFTATRSLAIDADIIFCPFTYLMDPIIRSMSEVTLRNAIVVLDEAHNVEDICRESASFTFTEKEICDSLSSLRDKSTQLRQFLRKCNEQGGVEWRDRGEGTTDLVTKLVEMDRHMDVMLALCLELHGWLADVTTSVQPASDAKGSRTLGWEQLILSLTNTSRNRNLLFDPKSERYLLCNAAMVALGTPDSSENRQDAIEALRPSSTSVVCVEKFLFFLKYFTKEGARSTYRLNLVVERPTAEHVRVDSEGAGPRNNAYCVGGGGGSWGDAEGFMDTRAPPSGMLPIRHGFIASAHLWCMSPGLAFVDAFNECSSVVLASGTLCPTETLRTELGLQFSVEVEGEQVIPREQIFASVIKTGPGGKRLLANYKNINDNDDFIDELARIVSSVCSTVPSGVLCFLSSYRMMDRLYEYLHRSGLLREIEAYKVLLREPRRSSEMSDVLSRYEAAISRPRLFGPNIDGALMLAVFRGKVSEGIDFADDRARCVIAVGIPYPSWVDEQVKEKRKYNDENAKRQRILTGDQWYTSQAYRALNQALGRCLRHRGDWGAIVMVDERLAAPPSSSSSSSARISRWIREHTVAHSNYGHFLDDLKLFVEKMGIRESELREGAVL